MRQESEQDIKNGQSTFNKSANTLPAVDTDSGSGNVNVRTNRVDGEKASFEGVRKTSNNSQDVTM